MNKDPFSISASSLVLRYKARSYDQKLAVGKIPLKQGDQQQLMKQQSRQLTPVKRKQLEQIRDRDNTKNKMERMGKIILRKLCFKYGNIHRDSLKWIIDGYLTEDMDLTNDLISHIDGLASEKLFSRSYPNGHDMFANKSMLLPPPGLDTTSVMTSDPQSRSDANIPVGNEWQLLHTYDTVKHKQAEQQRQQFEALKKMKFKEALDHQIMLAKELQSKQQQESSQYTSCVEKDIAQHRAEELRKQALAKKKSEEEMLIRKQQIQEAHARKLQEKESERVTAQQQIKQALDNLQQEKAAIEAKHRKIQETRMAVEQSNAENKRRMNLAKQRQQEEDNKLMKEYSDKLDREEAERARQFQKRMEESEHSSSRYMADQLQRDIEKRRQEEMAQLQEHQRKEAMDAAAEQEKEMERKRRLEADRIANERMVEYHKRVEAKELREKELLKQKYKQELETNKLEEDENKRKKRFLQQQYRNSLFAQMQQTGGGYHSARGGLLSARSGFSSPQSPGSPSASGILGSNSMEAREREINLGLLRQAIEELPELTTA